MTSGKFEIRKPIYFDKKEGKTLITIVCLEQYRHRILNVFVGIIHTFLIAKLAMSRFYYDDL